MSQCGDHHSPLRKFRFLHYVVMNEFIDIKLDRLAYSIEEAAYLASLSVPKIRKDIKAGALKSIKRGTRRLIPVSELKRYLSVEN